MLKKIFVVLIIIAIIIAIYLKFFEREKVIKKKILEDVETYSSNILVDVEYISKDVKGNEYLIKAKKGEIDFNNSNIIFLEDVKAIIKLTNSEKIYINSNFGKYNTSNFDTIFSKNVMVEYLENKITGEYLDFSLVQNRMIISKNIIYTNLENILKADVIEINIDTKDTKVFMYEKNKKVNVKNKNYYTYFVNIIGFVKKRRIYYIFDLKNTVSKRLVKCDNKIIYVIHKIYKDYYNI